MTKIKSIFILLPLFTLLPSSVSAQLDTRCFTEDACKAARKGLVEQSGGVGDGSGGWVVSAETKSACGEKNAEGKALGFCLPSGKTKTQIGFGGRREFEHIGDFIAYGYRYAIIIAGIVAVLIIIFSGIQWLVSGGNSEQISSAQKRIAGALMGLFLAVMSYLVLGFVNPALINLRLPQVWLVNNQAVVSPLCKNVIKGVKLSHLKEQKTTLTADQTEAAFIKAASSPGIDKDTTLCGNDYVSKTGGRQTCKGTFCEKKNNERYVCAPSQTDPLIDECQRGAMAGTIINTSLAQQLFPSWFTEEWTWPWVDENETEFWGLCANGDTFEVSSDSPTLNREETKTQTFIIIFNDRRSMKDIAAQKCGSKDAIQGFYFKLEMNEANQAIADEDHFVGKNNTDLGDDRTFGVIKKGNLKPYLYMIDDVEDGLVVTIDTSYVTDIDDGDPQRKKAYRDLGF